MSESLSGYKGDTLKVLKKHNVKIGDMIKVSNLKSSYQGILMPRSELADEKHIVIKIKSGYNVGIKVTKETMIENIGVSMKPSFVSPPKPNKRLDLPKVAILSTGGTIASRIDYRTGAVRPAISASDLYNIVPELADIAIIEPKILFSLSSEDISPRHWTKIAVAVGQEISRGVQGVVITHGTDTMGYTSSALSFSLQDLPVPVVIVGAQRSEDRPSSDAALNLVAAVAAAAHSPFAEVSVAMHKSISDKAILLHRGTKVRKMHTSRRDAFKTINSDPLAEIYRAKINILATKFRKREAKKKLLLKPYFEEKVALIKFYPGMSCKVIEHYINDDYRGIVLEGTGLGHTGREYFPYIKKALEKDIIIGMTSQCIWGRINMKVYTNGRDLVSMGVIPLEDMLPETALVKMMWVLAQTKNKKDAKELLTTNIANEFSARTI